jgi:PKD repeat protein
VAPASPAVGQAVTFTDASTDDGQVVGRAWDLDGDGQFDDGTGATASATFPAAGDHTVSLRVTDDGSPALSGTTSRTVSVSAAPPPPPPPPPGNLIANPSFETSLTGWSGYQATLAREAQAGAPDGGFVARVTRSTGTSFTIDGGRNVASAAAVSYTASAWVRAASASSVGKPIQIKLRERNAAGTVVADVGSPNVALSNSWQKVTVTRTAAAGNSLGVRLSHGSAVTGNAFFADAFTLTTG